MKNQSLKRIQYLSAVILLIGIAAIITGPGSNDLKPMASRVALTDENLITWAKSANLVADVRRQELIQIPVWTISGMMLSLQNESNILIYPKDDFDPNLFISLCMSIELARNNLVRVVEYEMRLDEFMRLNHEDDVLAGKIQIPKEPFLSESDQKDLAVYERNLDLVEDTLANLLPQLPPLFPEWDVLEMERSDPKSKTRKISWRIVSRSRFGPRILKNKEKPGVKAH